MPIKLFNHLHTGQRPAGRHRPTRSLDPAALSAGAAPAGYGNGAFPVDPSLGAMNVYPRLSHKMAVLAAGGYWIDRE